MTTATPFTAETFQNEYLTAGADTVDAVVTVTAADEPAAGVAVTDPRDRAEIIIVDTSASMDFARKMHEAKAAAAAAVDCLEDGVAFAVVAGTETTRMVWPAASTSLAVASPAERAAATQAISGLSAKGGTAIGTWLDFARELLGTATANARHAILLTDGRNEHQSQEELRQAVEACRGLFQCDCRGVGKDWVVAELRQIATELLGTVDIVADPKHLTGDFRAMISSSQSREFPDARLRLWAPQGAVVDVVRQVAPEVLDLRAAGTPAPSDPLARDYLLGGWSPGEVRDYHVRIRVEPAPVGREKLACRVSLVLRDDTAAAQALVRAVWTDDSELSTQIDRHVAHYTGQEELAEAIQEGLAARAGGDDVTATVRLGRAAQLAEESGHGDTLKLLSKVVDIVDAESGTVRLRSGVGKIEEMTLDTRSHRTVRLARNPKEEGS